MATRSHYTDGTDHPNETWLQKKVTYSEHPEWGFGRILRWYPAAHGKEPSVRVKFEKMTAPKVLSLSVLSVLE